MTEQPRAVAEAKSSGQEAASESPPWRPLALLAAPSAAFLAYVIASSYWARFAVCRDVVASSGAVVRQCEPAQTTDAVVVVGAILLVGLALFVLPNVTEISILGIGSIKREIQRQRENQETIDARLAKAEVTLKAWEWSEAELEQRRWLAYPRARAPVVPVDQAALIAELFVLAHQIDRAVSSIPGLRKSADAAMRSYEQHGGGFGTLPGKAAAFERWAEDFGDQIRAALSVRDRVAYGGEMIPEDALREALESASEAAKPLADLEASL